MDVGSAAEKALSSKGQKLHIHSAHVHGTDNGKYIVRHELRDKHGRPPTDGQRAEAEHSLNNPEELAAHIQAIAPQMTPTAQVPEDTETPAQ